MRKVFNYTKFNNEALDMLVESGIALAEAYAAGKESTPEYKEANEKFNVAFMEECVNAIPTEKFESLEQIKNPMIHGDLFFQKRFDAVLAKVMTPVVPKLISQANDQLYEVTQLGWGDNARYRVRSNELFIVNSQAEGIARGGVQTSYDQEYTINTHKAEIACYVDWYHVAAAKQDWGYIVAKTAYGFATYIEALVAKKLYNAVATSGSTWGIGGYIAAGMTDANWLTTSRNVSLANGGAQVYGFGTKIALANVLPAAANTQFRYDEKSSIVRTGILPDYKGVPIIEMDNALYPNTINGTPTPVLSDSIIYLLPAGMDRPVKVAFEGNSVTVTKNPQEMADHTYTFQIDMKLGVDVVIGAKFGAITL